MNIFLDDTREPKEVKWVSLPRVAWIICRDYNSFVQTLEDFAAKGEYPSIISFDHDLGDNAYKEIIRTQGQEFNYANLNGEKTGLHCAEFLVDFCEKKKIDLPQIYVHTQNPVGRENIVGLFESYLNRN